MADLVGTARITATDLIELTGTAVDTAVLNSFINTANALIEEHLVGEGLSETILTEIEKYLAAHFLAISRDRQAKSEAVGGEWSVTFMGNAAGSGFDATTFGQNAIALDVTGTLSALGAKRAKFNTY